MPHSSGHHHSSHRSSSHRSSSHRSSSHHYHHRSSSRYHSGSYSGYGYSERRNSNRISSVFFPGAKRYSYLSHGKVKYIYSQTDPAKRFHPARLLVLLFYIPFIFGGLFMVKTSSTPSLKKPDSTEIIIKDEADVITSQDESELRTVLRDFYKKSGVVPSVITVEDQKWKDIVFDKENWERPSEYYAYTRYLSEFNDEMHWLIVYSDPSADFEPMQGNNTDAVLTEDIGDIFINRLETNLKDKNTGVGASVSNAFETIMPLISKPSLFDRLASLGPAIFLFLFVGFHAFFMAGLYDLKYKRAVYDPDPDEARQLGNAAAGAAAGITQNYGTSADMSRAYPQSGYQNYGNSYASAGNGYQNPVYGQSGAQNGGYMQDIGMPGGMQTQDQSYGQSGYQTQYAQNNGGYMQNAYPNSGAQSLNSSYGQSSAQSYGAQSDSSGYMPEVGLPGGIQNNSQAYGQSSVQNYGVQNNAPAYGQNSYGTAENRNNSSVSDRNDTAVGTSRPQPVPPGCTTCSSCGNVYHISDRRCPLCGGK